ncbi:MAG TPA: ATP-binding protein [Terriglobales bacterium]|nr:ATP-binding protein [Terriglobales bacterium]
MRDDAVHSSDFERNKLIIRLDITVSADINSISAIVEGILAITSEMKCAAGKEFEIETAIREALANAILHGCHNDPAKQVQCCVACDKDRGMIIVVRDPGQGFDPSSIPSPVMGENVYSEHGRGIYLINQLMDSAWYEHGGTELHMLKN